MSNTLPFSHVDRVVVGGGNNAGHLIVSIALGIAAC